MVLGDSYKHDLAKAVFIRTMDAGTFPLANIRKKYFYISNNKFPALLQELHFRNIITLDLNAETVTFSQAMYNVVNFLEVTKFVENIKVVRANNNQIIPQALAPYLRVTNYVARNTPKENFTPRFDLKKELYLCLKEMYDENYFAEINALDIFVAEKNADE